MKGQGLIWVQIRQISKKYGKLWSPGNTCIGPETYKDVSWYGLLIHEYDTVKHFNFARLKFREWRIQAIREHLIFANSRGGGSELSDFDKQGTYRKLLKNAKYSQALNFREFRGFANLRENKVLAKIKCYTVHFWKASWLGLNTRGNRVDQAIMPQA